MRATAHVRQGADPRCWLGRWLARGSPGRGVTMGSRPSMPPLREITASYPAATGLGPGANAARNMKFQPTTQPYGPRPEAWPPAGQAAPGAGPGAATRYQCPAHP